MAICRDENSHFLVLCSLHDLDLLVLIAFRLQAFPALDLLEEAALLLFVGAITLVFRLGGELTKHHLVDLENQLTLLRCINNDPWRRLWALTGRDLSIVNREDLPLETQHTCFKVDLDYFRALGRVLLVVPVKRLVVGHVLLSHSNCWLLHNRRSLLVVLVMDVLCLVQAVAFLLLGLQWIVINASEIP